MRGRRRGHLLMKTYGCRALVDYAQLPGGIVLNRTKGKDRTATRLGMKALREYRQGR